MPRQPIMIMAIVFGTMLISEIFSAPNPQFTYYHHTFSNNYFQPIKHASYPQQMIPLYNQPSFGFFNESSTMKNNFLAQNDFNNPTASPSENSRIVGGVPVLAGRMPYMAGYFVPDQNNKKYLCGGTLITPNHVLTAAHCLTSLKTEFKPIGAQVIINSVLFSMKLPKPVELRKIKAVKIHELFTRVPLNAPIDERIPNEYDIAILTLDAPVTTVKPVTLAKCGQSYADIEGKATAIAAGWGVTDPNDGNSVSQKLLGTQLSITTNPFCQTFNGPTDPPMRSTQMCAYWAPGGRSTCTGDSGGPLLYSSKTGYIQVGIMSFGPRKCGEKGEAPNVMTRVSKFFDWINENTGVVLEQ